MNKITHFKEWFFTIINKDGSTRPVALMRIGFGLIVWTRFGSSQVIYWDMTGPGLILSFVFFLTTFLMVIGLFSRTSTMITALCLIWNYYYNGVYLGDDDIPHHHVYFLMASTFLLSFTHCGKSYSVDRWLHYKRTGSFAPERGPLWATYLIGFQLSMIYFWGTVDKLKFRWFSGLVLEQLSMFYYFGSDYPPFPGFKPLMIFLAWTSSITEVLLAFGLWFKKYNKPIMLLGILFHAGISMTLSVHTFTATVWIVYLVFLDPDEVHRFIDKMSGYGSKLEV